MAWRSRECRRSKEITYAATAVGQLDDRLAVTLGEKGTAWTGVLQCSGCAVMRGVGWLGCAWMLGGLNLVRRSRVLKGFR